MLLNRLTNFYITEYSLLHKIVGNKYIPSSSRVHFTKGRYFLTGKPSPFSSFVTRLLFSERNKIMIHATSKDKIGVIYAFFFAFKLNLCILKDMDGSYLVLIFIRWEIRSINLPRQLPARDLHNQSSSTYDTFILCTVMQRTCKTIKDLTQTPKSTTVLLFE